MRSEKRKSEKIRRENSTDKDGSGETSSDSLLISLCRGKVEIPLSELTPSESKDFWAPVDTVGEIHLELTYFPIG